MNKKLGRAYVLCLIASAAVLIGVLLLRAMAGPNLGARRFDSAIWKQNRDTNKNNPRLEMIDDLRENYLRAVISREAVSKLLGEYAWERNLGPADPGFRGINDSSRYDYYLGAYKMENWFFSVYFDHNDRLMKTEVNHHSD